MIKAVIFDMDGLLVDSEPFWKEAEKTIFKKVDIDLTESMCAQTTGLGMEDVIKYWYSRYPWDTSLITFKMLYDELLKIMKKNFSEVIQLKEGVLQTIHLFSKSKIPMAIASSSPLSLINEFLNSHNLRPYIEEVFSSEKMEAGKPHPAVYLATAKALNIMSDDCLVFEDSFFGLLAAKSAKMKAIAILNSDEISQTKYDFADLKLNTLLNFNISLLDQLNGKNKS